MTALSAAVARARAAVAAGAPGGVTPPPRPRDPPRPPLVRPGAVDGPYPERRPEGPRAWLAVEASWRAVCTTRQVHRERQRFLAELRAAREARSLDWPIAALRARGFVPEVCARLLVALEEPVQACLGYRPHEVQMLAAWTLLQGCLVEAATGEGKTLSTALAAAVAGLAGVPVHVLTANDYLARRDAELLAPFFAQLGLRVAAVVSDTPPDERRAAYAADITYAPARELAFDHLRDRLAFDAPDSGLRWAARRDRGEPLLRGLCLGLIDEVDAVLCDEALVPLVLAGPAADTPSPALLQTALDAARSLSVPAEARLVDGGRRAALTEAGRRRLAADRTLQADPWADPVFREDWVTRALTALHALRRDRDYAVDGDAVVFVDPITGRASPQRRWSRGLHQLLAAKEGLPPPEVQDTVAQITYQQLFARYHRLGGLSGTIGEVALEMAVTYGLPVVRLPRHRASRLALAAPRAVRGQGPWLDAIAASVRSALDAGRPVLVGTDSIADSEAIARRLRAIGLRPAVLNAVQGRLEHEVVARAGQAGRLTIATQMAGRGTDIRLGDGIAGRGGLHVVACTVHAGRRHWRQLVGRAGRQGDPGSADTLVRTDEGLLARRLPAWICRAADRWPAVAVAAWWVAGWREEVDAMLQRRRISRAQGRMNRRIAFTGPEA